ncbi:MAG: PAS domain S-box protein [Burkholderiales bacterium]
MSLRYRVNLIVTVLITFFTLAMCAIVIDDTRRAIREEMEAGGKVTLQWLTNVLSLAPFSGAASSDERLLEFLHQLGRVRAHEFRLLSAQGEVQYQSPPSIYKSGRTAPAWFSALVAPKLPEVSLRAGDRQLLVSQDASRAVLDAWDDLKILVLVMLAFLVALNAAVFWLVGNALKPIGSVLRGLSDMEQGRLHTRLPSFAFREFEAISHTFNRMAGALEESHQQNARLALIAKQSSDAIMIQDLRGEISFWNPAAEKMFGYTAAEIAGLSARLITPAARAHELADIQKAVLLRKVIENQETERSTKNGTPVQVALSAAPLIDPDTGEVIGEICSMRDITEHKRVQEAERELASNRELTHIIQSSLEEERRGIARELHDELGQCVTAIKTIGTVIANQTKHTVPEVHTSAQTIVSVASHIYDVVHGIIRKLRPSALDHLGLAEALREVAGTWRARHPSIDCELRLAGDLDKLGETVNITIYRIVQECLTNVVKHAAATQVVIGVTREGDVIVVTVRDNGQGASQPDRESRFGLLGMRERVQALDGEFSVESEPGQGMFVTARVPVRKIEPSSLAA